MKKREEINLKKAQKELKRFFKFVDIKNVEYRMEDDRLIAIFNSSLKAFDDNVIARFEIHKDNKALFGFTFDHLEVNEQTLRMINTLNEKNPYFVAYIDAGKKYLRLVHTVMLLREEDVYDYAAAVLGEYRDDDMVPLLEPLCILSEGDSED